MNLKNKPAFPRGAYSFKHLGEEVTIVPSEGMTLLQYYVGELLSSRVANGWMPNDENEEKFLKQNIELAKKQITELEKLETNQTKENE